MFDLLTLSQVTAGSQLGLLDGLGFIAELLAAAEDGDGRAVPRSEWRRRNLRQLFFFVAATQLLHKLLDLADESFLLGIDSFGAAFLVCKVCFSHRVARIDGVAQADYLASPSLTSA